MVESGYYCSMQTIIIGLGRMGKSIAKHLLEQGESVIVYNRTREKTDELVSLGATPAYSIAEIPQKAKSSPLVVFLYVTAGEVTDQIIFGKSNLSSPTSIGDPENKLDSRFRENDILNANEKGLIDFLPKDTIIIDGGNSFFQDSQKRYQMLKEKGIHFLDMGTSGGLEGARHGACLMVGGDETIYTRVEPLLTKIAAKDGYGYFGPSGAGHYVKMIHNAVEYGMMGAIAEGFNLIQNSEFSIQNKDLAKLAKVWAHGSIISGHLMNMAEKSFSRSDFEKISGSIPKGETEEEMEWLSTIGIANPVIQTAREQRVESRKSPSFIGRVISALRREFGGHNTSETL